MGRTMPYECEHGRIVDWGDFGGEDSVPELCPECDAEANARALRGRIAREWLAENAHWLVTTAQGELWWVPDYE